jgi:AraC-like DNA-binding protein
MLLHEKLTLDSNVKLMINNGQYAVYKTEGAFGKGFITCYQLFPGVILAYNDFNIEHSNSQVMPKTDCFMLNYCHEGRLDWELENGNCMYQDTSTLLFDTWKKQTGSYGSPLRHYRGLTIYFFIDEAQECLSAILESIPVDLHILREKLCPGEWPRKITTDKIPSFRFDNLYNLHNMNEEVRMYLFRIKILELLLYLKILPTGEKFIHLPRFRKSQVDTIKAIEQFMTANFKKHYTLEELSSRFNIPATSMKRCFKGVYGSSIYTYMRSWRMNTAAVRLRQTNESIVSIAESFGYDNASKFSSAFRDVMGKSPSEYRREYV